MAKIDIEAIFPKDLDSFIEELGGDERIAKLHQTHYDKKRVKTLLKVSGKLNELGPEATSNNFITEVP